MIAVFEREIGAYFKGVPGYLLSAFLLVFAGIYCMAYNLSGYYANFEYVLSSIAFIYLIAVPIISMRAVAEEKRQRTDQLLYSLPIRLSDVVLGKYLAMLAVLAVPTLILGLYPLVLTRFGTVSLAVAYGALLAFFLMGACLLSIGLMISALSDSPVSSAVMTLVVLLLLYFMTALASYLPTDGATSLIALCVLGVIFALIVHALTKNPIIAVLVCAGAVGGLLWWYQADAAAFAGLFADMLTAVSVFDRFDAFVEGVFDLTAVVYWLSVTAVCLFLTVQAMEKRRWSE